MELDIDMAMEMIACILCSEKLPTAQNEVMEKHLQEQHSVSKSMTLVEGLCKLDGAKLELVINIVYNLNSSDNDKVEDKKEKVEAIDSDGDDWMETVENHDEDGAKLEPKSEIETDSDEEEYKPKKTRNQAIKTRKQNPKTQKIEIGEDIQYKCDQCGKIAKDKHKLKDHMKKHSDKREFACEQCTKRFKSSHALKNHIKAHEGIFDKECPDCEMKFVSTSSLQAHIKRKHTPGYGFSCDQCANEFKTKGQLGQHMTLHTGEKPYKCRGGCDKTFRTPNSRKCHERLHRGVKEFGCTYCSKMFMQPHQLKDHIKRHEGTKDHVCEVCGKAYVESAQARNCKHNQTSHSQIHSIVQPSPVQKADPGGEIPQPRVF